MRANRIWQPTGNRQNGRPRDRFRLLEFTNPRTGSLSWRVAGSKRNGERVRENFSDTQAAQARKLQLESEWLGTQTETSLRATKLTETQLRLAEVAFVKLDDDQEILSAVDYWRKHGRQQAVIESPRLDGAVDQFKVWLAQTETLRDATKRNLDNRVTIFANSVPNARLSTVTPEFVEAFLDGRDVGNATRDNDRRALSRFFSWCIERPRRWMNSNPAHLVTVEQGEKAPPAILTVDECERLLRAAEAHKNGALVPYVSVCLFAGLRPFEAARLDWQQVNLEDGEIRLESVQTKTKRPRVVSIHPTLARWLKRCQGKPFFPPNWRKDFDAVKEAAGFGTPDPDDENRAHLKPWPLDVMRHTAISHAFRECGSYGLVAEAFGNSEAVIKAHYQGRVSTADTKRFYSLKPSK